VRLIRRTAAVLGIFIAAIVLTLALVPGLAEAVGERLNGAKIMTGTITADQLATSAVASAEILDDTVAVGDINNSATLAGNPAYAASECYFSTTGFICEGATADAIELLVTFGDPASSDKTVTVPATTGTVLLDTAATASTTFSCTGACTYDAGGANAITVGSADVTSVTFTVDGTGTGEIAMPAGAVDSTEILDATIATGDLANGAVSVLKLEGLANTASTLRAVPLMAMRLNFAAADFGANNDVILTTPATHAVILHDVVATCATLEGGPLTATLRTAANGGGSAISSALNLNSGANAPQRTTTLAANTIAAATAFYFNASADPATIAGCQLYIPYSHTD